MKKITNEKIAMSILLVMILAVMMPAFSTVSATMSVFSIAIKGLPSSVEVDTVIPVTLENTGVLGEDYTNIRFVVDVKGPGEAIFNATDTNGTAWNIVEHGWGPPSGFPAGVLYASPTLDVEVEFTKAGTYSIVIKLVDVADAGAVVYETNTITVNVTAPIVITPETTAVIDQINALKYEGNVSEYEAAVVAARAAYKALNDEQKTLVTNLELLVAAESYVAHLKSFVHTNDLVNLAKLITSDTKSVFVDLDKPGVVTKDIFEIAKEHAVYLTFMVSDKYVWNFNGANIKTANVKDLNLTITETASAEAKAAIEASTAKNVLALNFTHHGVLPGKAEVMYNVGDNYKVGEKLVLYYYNPTTKQIEEVKKDITVDEDGWVSFEIEHCSDYFLSTTSGVAIPSVKTGDINIIAISIISIIALAGVVVIIKKIRA